MFNLVHRLKHFFGINTGIARSFYMYNYETKNDDLYMGFWCNGCDTISGVHIVPDNLFKKDR